MNTRLISVTSDAEKLILYIARVSNPENQESEDTRLINYLIKHYHWSPFEHAHMTVEIKTSRAIAAQILRHRSFSFQEFSQRYAKVQEFEPIELRRQAEKNRQSSIEVFDPILYVYEYSAGCNMASEEIDAHIEACQWLYEQLIEKGVAKECARMILPMTTQTTMYMTGNIRSWIHYLQLRTQEDTQKEHRLVAEGIRTLFTEQFPIISKALEWL